MQVLHQSCIIFCLSQIYLEMTVRKAKYEIAYFHKNSWNFSFFFTFFFWVSFPCSDRR